MDESTIAMQQSYYDMIKAEHDANNAWSAEQAQKAMDYQTEMSNTAHQREVADLKAAGLNPVLSAGGAGATTGSGLMATRSDSNVDALYGLAKQAIDAQIDTANAMARSAKYISGAAGYSSATSESLDWSDMTAIDKLSSAWDVLKRGVADRLYRRYGIKQDTTMAAFDIVENTVKDAPRIAKEYYDDARERDARWQAALDDEGKPYIKGKSAHLSNAVAKLVGKTSTLGKVFQNKSGGFSGKSGKF